MSAPAHDRSIAARVRASASDSFRRLNPHLFGVGAVAVQEPQRGARREGQPGELVSVPARVGYRVTLTAYVRRNLDTRDNLRAAMKPLVDRITETLGFPSDDNPLLQWEYGQQLTHGGRGVAVRIETLNT